MSGEALPATGHAPVEPAPASTDAEQEAALFFGISASRLRSRLKWGIFVLVLSILIPVDMIGKAPIFVWDALPEMPIAGVLAVLSLPLAGLAMAVGLIVTKRGASLGFVVLAALFSAAVLRKLGADRTAWEAISVPDAMSSRPVGALLAIALTSAAGNLKFRPATRWTAPYLVGAAWLSALYFYAWPERGEAPFMTIVRALGALPELPDFRYQLGLLLIVFVMIWPLVVTASGLLLLKLTPEKDESWFTMLANWTLSLWLFLLATRTFMMPQAGLSLMTYLLTVLMVTVIIVLGSASVAIVVESFFVKYGDEAFTKDRELDEEIALADDPFAGKNKPRPRVKAAIGWDPRRAALVAGVVVTLVAVVQFSLSRPPTKGTEWAIAEPTPKGDELFGSTLRRWMSARRRWDMSTRLDSGAEARLGVKEAGKALIEQAKELDPELGRAVEQLVVESDELDLGGRKWARLIEAVNEASRKAKLPYYIDPDFAFGEQEGEVRYHFFAHPYLIEKVNPYDVDGDSFATLMVRRLDDASADHLRLGFSRDRQPFALVNTSSTRRKGQEMTLLSSGSGCVHGIVENHELVRGLERCGELYYKYADGKDKDIVDAVTAGTERHELQHQIDGPHLPLAGPVLTLLESYDPSAQDRVNREVSAFMAELTTAGMAPKLALIQLAQYLFVREEGVYAKTAIVIFEKLSGLSIRRGFGVDGNKFWSVYEGLFEMDDDKLRSLAREHWESMFDAKLAEPKLK